MRVLFVCLGNICRSPLAECLFRDMAKARGVAGRFHVDSAGTGNWQAGRPPDAAMRAVARRHGCRVYGVARQVNDADLRDADVIVAMDESIRERLIEIGCDAARIRLLLDHLPECGLRDVPDPYQQDEAAFEAVHSLVRPACERLLDSLLKDGRV